MRKILNKFSKKDSAENAPFPADQSAPKSNEASPKGKKRTAGKFDKYITYIDSLLGLVSVWGAIILFFYVSPHLPELKWPYYLDEILFFLLLNVLVFITVSMLRPLVLVALVAGSAYLIAVVVLDLFQDSIDKTKTTQTIRLGNEKVIDNILNRLSGEDGPVLKKLDSIEKQNAELQERQRILENKIDSLTIKPIKIGHK